MHLARISAGSGSGCKAAQGPGQILKHPSWRLAWESGKAGKWGRLLSSMHCIHPLHLQYRTGPWRDGRLAEGRRERGAMQVRAEVGLWGTGSQTLPLPLPHQLPAPLGSRLFPPSPSPAQPDCSRPGPPFLHPNPSQRSQTLHPARSPQLGRDPSGCNPGRLRSASSPQISAPKQAAAPAPCAFPARLLLPASFGPDVSRTPASGRPNLPASPRSRPSSRAPGSPGRGSFGLRPTPPSRDPAHTQPSPAAYCSVSPSI